MIDIMDPANDSCDLIFEEARQLLDEQQYAEAIDAFTDFIALVPESEGAYGNRGLAYLSMGEDEKAMDDFKMVISINPEDAMGYAMMAEALRNLGRDEEALEMAVEALTIDDKAAEAYMVRGWLFARAGQYDSAVADLEKYVELVDEPGEFFDLLEACKCLAADNPCDPEGNPLDDPEAQEAFLSACGFSFCFEYRGEHEEEGLFCPYAHCIRSMPRRGYNAPITCPIAGFQCPGGPQQVEICCEYPPSE